MKWKRRHTTAASLTFVSYIVNIWKWRSTNNMTGKLQWVKLAPEPAAQLYWALQSNSGRCLACTIHGYIVHSSRETHDFQLQCNHHNRNTWKTWIYHMCLSSFCVFQTESENRFYINRCICSFIDQLHQQRTWTDFGLFDPFGRSWDISLLPAKLGVLHSQTPHFLTFMANVLCSEAITGRRKQVFVLEVKGHRKWPLSGRKKLEGAVRKTPRLESMCLSAHVCVMFHYEQRKSCCSFQSE